MAGFPLWHFSSYGHSLGLDRNMLCKTVLFHFASQNVQTDNHRSIPDAISLLSQTLKWALPAGTPAKENAVLEMFLAPSSRGADQGLESLTSLKEKPTAAASGLNSPDGRALWN